MREPFDCQKCGTLHSRCHGHSVRCSRCDWSGGNKYVDSQTCIKCGGELFMRPCRKWPLKNLSVCEVHGGGNSQSQHAAERRQVEHELRKTLEITGHVEPVTDPFMELAQVAGEIRQARTQLAEMVARLPSIEDVGTERYATQLSVVVRAWQDFLQMSAKVATDMSRLDLTERLALLQARIDQETAAIVENAMNAALKSAGLPADVRASIMAEFGKLLRVQEQPAAIGSGQPT